MRVVPGALTLRGAAKRLRSRGAWVTHCITIAYPGVHAPAASVLCLDGGTGASSSAVRAVVVQFKGPCAPACATCYSSDDSVSMLLVVLESGCSFVYDSCSNQGDVFVQRRFRDVVTALTSLHLWRTPPELVCAQLASGSGATAGSLHAVLEVYDQHYGRTTGAATASTATLSRGARAMSHEVPERSSGSGTISCRSIRDDCRRAGCCSSPCSEYVVPPTNAARLTASAAGANLRKGLRPVVWSDAASIASYLRAATAAPVQRRAATPLARGFVQLPFAGRATLGSELAGCLLTRARARAKVPIALAIAGSGKSRVLDESLSALRAHLETLGASQERAGAATATEMLALTRHSVDVRVSFSTMQSANEADLGSPAAALCARIMHTCLPGVDYGDWVAALVARKAQLSLATTLAAVLQVVGTPQTQLLLLCVDDIHRVNDLCAHAGGSPLRQLVDDLLVVMRSSTSPRVLPVLASADFEAVLAAVNADNLHQLDCSLLPFDAVMRSVAPVLDSLVGGGWRTHRGATLGLYFAGGHMRAAERVVCELMWMARVSRALPMTTMVDWLRWQIQSEFEVLKCPRAIPWNRVLRSALLGKELTLPASGAPPKIVPGDRMEMVTVARSGVLQIDDGAGAVPQMLLEAAICLQRPIWSPATFDTLHAADTFDVMWQSLEKFTACALALRLTLFAQDAKDVRLRALFEGALGAPGLASDVFRVCRNAVYVAELASRQVTKVSDAIAISDEVQKTLSMQRGGRVVVPVFCNAAGAQFADVFCVEPATTSAGGGRRMVIALQCKHHVQGAGVDMGTFTAEANKVGFDEGANIVFGVVSTWPLHSSLSPGKQQIALGTKELMACFGSTVVGYLGVPLFSGSKLAVDINIATHGELALIPGVGDVTAAEIIRVREESGAFKSVDEARQRVRTAAKSSLPASCFGYMLVR